MNLFTALKKKNLHWKKEIILPYLKNGESVLDFGCGDLFFASELKKNNKTLDITGVDVVDFSNHPKNVTFVIYDGIRLPFKDNAFDTVISFYVFHHCTSAEKAFLECLRVAKKKVIFVESVKRYHLENYLMATMDYIFNIWKSRSIPYANQFFSVSTWSSIIKKSKGKLKSHRKINNRSLALLPIGGIHLFEVYKKL